VRATVVARRDVIHMTGYSFDTLRQPEYTGENRCTPCTIVNVVIAAVASAALAIASPVVGVVAFVAFAGIIYLRGYLVPGTPTLTKRYLPERVLAWFDKAPAPGEEYALGVDADGDVDVEETLVGVGALEVCEDGSDLCLTPEFREAWRAHVDRLRGGDPPGGESADFDGAAEAGAVILADVLDVRPERVSIATRGSAVDAEIDGGRIGRWESRAAFVADMAAERALEERTSDWSELPVEQRSHLLSSLRIFLERCPECGGRVAMEEETVESCCRSWEVVAGACRDCDARLFEIDMSQVQEDVA
jgi:hypothetical protein